MSVIERIDSSDDVKKLSAEELLPLADELRAEIIKTVSRNGGHLAPSLGTVELSIALCRVFDPAFDRIVWDVGHQTYAWKLLTGRRDKFSTIRTHGGLSGFSNPEESQCDAFVSGHAGIAFAVAEGMAAARDRIGGTENVLAVIGDASITNGVALEALNNCSSLGGKMIVVLNDNEMSISENVGALSRKLGRMITGIRYNRVKAAAERGGHRLKLTFLRDYYHRIERFFKSMLLGSSYFENYGLRYIGPIDGHDLKAVEDALTVAKEDKNSVIIHIVTVKGKGFRPAEVNPTQWHGVGPFDLEAVMNRKSAAPEKMGWGDVFGDEVAAIAKEDSRVCALTAAMKTGTGLQKFSEIFPERFFDVGICESHLVAFAAGLAANGMKPAVAVYSTFLQRAIDNVMHDLALMRLPVVVGIDRAGVVGQDGRTHQGVFDIPMLRCIPDIAIMQPKDAAELRAMVRLAFNRKSPVFIRYPRGVPPTASEIPSVEWGKAEPLSGENEKLQLWALGDQVEKAKKVALMLAKHGIGAGIVNARFVKPLDCELITRQIANGARIVTLENGALAGGFGEAVQSVVPSAEVMKFGWTDEFVPHGTVTELEQDFAFTAEAVAERILRSIKG